MKKLILFFVAIVISTAAMAQQKSCYMYSQKVFQSMPEYTEAVSNIEATSKALKDKAAEMLNDAKTMFEMYKDMQGSLSTTKREELKKRIITMEKSANDFEKEAFGEDGELAKKQKELMSPIEKKVLAVVEMFAKKNGYDMIFDFSLVKATIYQSPKLDVTNQIIEAVKNYNYK